MEERSVGLKEKKGQPPGSLIFVGNQKTEKSKITVIEYDESTFRESQPDRPEQLLSRFQRQDSDTDRIVWINIAGLHDTEWVKFIGEQTNLHSLWLEDILNTRHRPKVDMTDKHVLLILRMLHRGSVQQDKPLETEHIAMLLGDGWIVTFQENETDPFDEIRRQLRDCIGKVRFRPVDYLMYRLVDTIVDEYLQIGDELIRDMADLEERISIAPTRKMLTEIYTYKKRQTLYRASVLPARDMVYQLKSSDNVFLSEVTRLFLDDLRDHTHNAGEMADHLAQSAAGLLEAYYSSMSFRMNEVMKVLTIVSTIFIPLTFLAGIYGMNFAYMPELQWKWGYFVILSLMLGTVVGMIVFFKRKKWF